MAVSVPLVASRYIDSPSLRPVMKNSAQTGTMNSTPIIIFTQSGILSIMNTVAATEKMME